ncbi:MAG: glycosyltransferase family 4 protein [Rikenellaceae bacterium]|jgi:glycosyltransferase involved in cell wall biosynthesis|nr:glycosyltransferase family 4 protein [Rikenellaceae bacterium]
MRVVVTHNDFRVYFPPRLLALQRFLEARGDELYVVELFGESIDYKFAEDDKSAFRHHEFLFPTYRGVSMNEIRRRLVRRLDEIAPDVVVAVGAVAFPAGATAVYWAARRGRAVATMDNAQWDTFPRNVLNRQVKKRIFRHVGAFLVPAPAWDGSMLRWGFRQEQIFYGLNVCDNDFWMTAPDVQDAQGASGAPDASEGFFLSVGRLVSKKNHLDIVRAYKRYAGPRELVIIGDGPVRGELQEYISAHGLNVRILPFKGAEELREYYHRAACFIIASNREETWGIVVNEAMCGGCAVIASDQTGCASTLVRPGENGYIFPTGNVEGLAACMADYDALTVERRKQMGRASTEIVGHWGLENFCAGIVGAVDYAVAHKRGKPCLLDKLILWLWRGRHSYQV